MREDIKNEDVANLYLSGKSMKEIAKIYNVSTATIRNRLDKCGINRRNASESHTIHKIDEKEMIEIYLNGMNLLELGEKYGVAYGTIKLRLLRNNVKLRTKSESKILEFKDYNPNKHGRKYFLNHEYFKTWSKNMAYIVGFLSADGYISDGGYLRIALQEQDVDLLHKINKELDSTYEVKRVMKKCGEKYYPSCELLISSKHMINDLIEIGVTQRKSFTVTMDKVPNEYKLDFIRGYFDGDGSVGEQWTKKSKTPMLRTRFFSGSEKMMSQIVEELYNHGVPSVSVKKYKDRNLYHILYSQLSSKKIYNLFYGDNPEIFLKRKKEKFDEILKKQIP